MKKGFLLLFVLVTIGLRAFANPGDTTIIQAHSGTWLSWYGNYDDSTLKFPDGTKTYDKILMVFTLGKYVCPGNPQYCSDWDYTVQTFLMPRTGDTLELGRFMTPYANNAYLSAGWTHDYVYDVTDFYPVLKDSANLRVLYQGYSGGFTASIKFIFIEGTPPRNVLGIKRIYAGGFDYGNPSNPIENHLPAVTAIAPAGTQSATLNVNITGHGSDNTGCSEFCSKYYNVFVNGSLLDQTTIWRNDCGQNDVSPQSGTWIYDRANWCPGALVYTQTHVLSGVTSAGSYSVNMDMEPYTGIAGTNGYASYIIQGNVFYYGASNRTNDVGVVNIVSPTNSNIYPKGNLNCNEPLIKFKNYGANAVTSVKFQYGANGGANLYTWTGNLASAADTIIALPGTADMLAASGTTNTFSVKVINVNNTTDGDSVNNKATSVFAAAPAYANRLVIKMKTNLSLQANGFSETEWKLYDINNNVVAQRINNSNTTLYTDTVILGVSCYKLAVTDAGCDGLNWWANPGAGAGTLAISRLTSNLPVNYTPTLYKGGDFGCGFTQYFTTVIPTAVEEITKAAVNMQLVPNPATDNVAVSIEGFTTEGGMLLLTDIMGRTISKNNFKGATTNLNVSSLANGVYSVVYLGKEGSNVKMQSKLVIAR